MFCKNCGNQMKDGEMFCSKCGSNNSPNRSTETNNQVAQNTNQNISMNSTNIGSNIPNMNGNNKNKLLIIGAIVVIVIVLILFLSTKGDGTVESNSDVTKAGETLKVENTYSVKVIGEPEKHKSSYEEDLVKLKINFDITGEEDTLFYVALCDKDKKQLYYGKGHLGEEEVDETQEKYLYFYSYTSDNIKSDIFYHTDYSKMSEVKYLEISNMLQTKKWYMELE